MTLFSKASGLAVVAATAALLSSSAVFAMGAELSQLEAVTQSELTMMCVDTAHVKDATLAQLSEINGIIEGGGDDAAKKQQIDFILGNDGPHLNNIAAFKLEDGKSQMERAVVYDLTRSGITVEHPENLTLGQLVQLDALFEGKQQAPSKAEVEAIVK